MIFDINVTVQGLTLLHTPHIRSTTVDEMKSCISTEATPYNLIVPLMFRR